jgi:hypothetical protein
VLHITIPKESYVELLTIINKKKHFNNVSRFQLVSTFYAQFLITVASTQSIHVAHWKLHLPWKHSEYLMAACFEYEYYYRSTAYNNNRTNNNRRKCIQ